MSGNLHPALCALLKDAGCSFVRQGGKGSHEVRGRPLVGGSPKTSVTIRLDQNIVEHYRGLGAGWQSKMNAALRKTIGTGRLR